MDTHLIGDHRRRGDHLRRIGIRLDFLWDFINDIRNCVTLESGREVLRRVISHRHRRIGLRHVLATKAEYRCSCEELISGGTRAGKHIGGHGRRHIHGVVLHDTDGGCGGDLRQGGGGGVLGGGVGGSAGVGVVGGVVGLGVDGLGAAGDDLLGVGDGGGVVGVEEDVGGRRGAIGVGSGRGHEALEVGVGPGHGGHDGRGGGRHRGRDLRRHGPAVRYYLRLRRFCGRVNRIGHTVSGTWRCPRYETTTAEIPVARCDVRGLPKLCGWTVGTRVF